MNDEDRRLAEELGIDIEDEDLDCNIKNNFFINTTK